MEQEQQQQQQQKKHVETTSGKSAKNAKPSGGGKRGGGGDKSYSHPWYLTTLKGHTDTVYDLSYSSNGKYLASCSEG